MNLSISVIMQPILIWMKRFVVRLKELGKAGYPRYNRLTITWNFKLKIQLKMNTACYFG